MSFETKARLIEKTACGVKTTASHGRHEQQLVTRPASESTMKPAILPTAGAVALAIAAQSAALDHITVTTDKSVNCTSLQTIVADVTGPRAAPRATSWSTTTKTSPPS
jgi:Flp pilus assembly protein TadG